MQNYAVSQASGFICVGVFACVQFPVPGVTRNGICQDPSFHSPFLGLFWHIMQEGQLALETYHALVNRYVLMGYIHFLEVDDNPGKKWSDLIQTVMPWLVMRNLVNIVVEV